LDTSTGMDLFLLCVSGGGGVSNTFLALRAERARVPLCAAVAGVITWLQQLHPQQQQQA
jgi:hypothetical protein